jgi:hypothetical protein
MSSHLHSSAWRWTILVVAGLGLLSTAACGSSGGPTTASGPSLSSTTASASDPGTSPVPLSTSASASDTAPAVTIAPGATPTTDQLKALLIDASAVPGDTFTRVSATQFDRNPAVGIESLFRNTAGSRSLTDIVLNFPTEAGAQTAVAAEEKPSVGAASLKPGYTESDVPVGDSAHLFAGADANGPATLIVFREGRFVVTMEFNSLASSDPVPASVVSEVALLQDQRIHTSSS